MASLEKVRWKVVGSFYALACGLSWLVALPLVNQGLRTPAAFAVLVLYMFGPAAAAAIVLQFQTKEPFFASIGLRFEKTSWLIVAWLLPILLSLAAMFAGGLFPGQSLDFNPLSMFERMLIAAPGASPEQVAKGREFFTGMSPLFFFALQMMQAGMAGLTVNAFVAVGEEAGWRGLMQRELEPLGFWPSSILIGVAWGFWHAPIILMGHNYPDHPAPGVGLMIVFCALLTPLMAHVRTRSKTLLGAAIFHGSMNAAAGVSLGYVVGGDDLTRGLTAAPGFVVLLAANVALAVSRRGSDQAPT